MSAVDATASTLPAPPESGEIPTAADRLKVAMVDALMRESNAVAMVRELLLEQLGRVRVTVFPAYRGKSRQAASITVEGRRALDDVARLGAMLEPGTVLMMSVGYDERDRWEWEVSR